MKPILFLAALAALASAGYWDIEQVDSAGWGAAVDMRWHPDSRLFLCYGDTSGIIRLASTGDSVWSYEELPQWRPARTGTQGFDVDRRGNIGVSYIDTDGNCWSALKTDTGWADIQTHFFSAWVSALTTLDTAGAPAITIQVGDDYLLARLLDAAWVTQTVKTGLSGWENTFVCYALGSSVDDVVWGVFIQTFHWPPACAYGTCLYSFQARDSNVSLGQITYEGGVSAASGCVDARDSVHTCYNLDGDLYLDQIVIDTIPVVRTSVRIDSLDRPQIAYVPRIGGLLYRYREAGTWYIFDLQTTGVTALSLAIDENSQPLVAYTTSEGVFLAHGVDIVGLSEAQKERSVQSPRMTATVVRNVLQLPTFAAGAEAALFDFCGRKVGELRAGANDISGLAPGVYFVREAQAQAQAQAVRKVIITR